MALPLGQETHPLPASVREIVIKARTSWLKNADVLDILLNFQSYGLPVAKEPPNTPPGGSLFLFDRRVVRFFRKDGHEWRKKADGKTVRETHEKLKIENKDALNCYYAHSEAKEALQRRCYWLLAKHGDIVLVHYLSSNSASRLASAAAARNHMCSDSEFAHKDRPSLRRAASFASCQSQSNNQILSASYVVTTGESLLADMGDIDSYKGFRVPSLVCRAPSESEVSRSTLNGEQKGLNKSASMSNLESPRGPSIPLAQSPDSRASSIGPLHTLPQFSGGTVQTGSTLGSYENLQTVGSVSQFPDTWNVPKSESRALSQKADAPSSSNQQSQENSEKSKRGRDSQGSPENVSDELSQMQLKPAVSLTRVNSDTLLVAPSVSGATSGKKSEAVNSQEETLVAGTSPKQILPSTFFSPFYAAAFSLCPILKGDQLLQDEKDVDLAHSAPVNGTSVQTLETSRLKRARPTSVQKHRQNAEALASQETNFLANLDSFHFNAHASEERFVRESCQALEPYFINNGHSMYTTSHLPHMAQSSMQQPPDSFQSFGQSLHGTCNTGRSSFHVGIESSYNQCLAPNKFPSQSPQGTFWPPQDPRRDSRQRSQYWDSGQVQNSQNSRQRSSFWPPEQQTSMSNCAEFNVYHPVQSEGNIEPPQSQDIDWPYDLPFL